MMNINVFYEEDVPFDKEEIKRFCACVCEKEELNIDMNVIFIDKEYIKKMNREYRGKDYPTDVLSFNYGNSGEIYICPEVSYENAMVSGNDYKKEILFLIAHGILHLKGYTHETMEKYEKMISLQEEYIKICYP